MTIIRLLNASECPREILNLGSMAGIVALKTNVPFSLGTLYGVNYSKRIVVDVLPAVCGIYIATCLSPHI